MCSKLFRAFVERDNSDLGLEEDLYDNGASPDIIANDGYYSRFFTQFDGENRYLLRCQVEGTEETDVNGGFTATKRLFEMGGDEKVFQGTTPPCCGSDAYTGNSQPATATGIFRREAVGGSIRVYLY